jgi:hypothetical protein
MNGSYRRSVFINLASAPKAVGCKSQGGLAFRATSDLFGKILCAVFVVKQFFQPSGCLLLHGWQNVRIDIER